MVSINSVRQTVLALLNKEERGYIAPTEFNKFAKQAQLDIFESYFYDKQHFNISRKGQNGEIQKDIQEKIDLFFVRNGTALTMSNGRFELPEDLYRLEHVYYTPSGGTRTIVDKINHKGSAYVYSSPLTEPTTTFPKYERYGDTVEVRPATITSNVTLDYIKSPSDPIWGYSRLGTSTTPQYNSARSTDFELHPSDEYRLVEMILLYSGVQVKQNDIIQVAAAGAVSDDANKKQ